MIRFAGDLLGMRWRLLMILMTAPSEDAAIGMRLYPDQAKFQKEEQRRFEILEAHWDVPLNEVILK